jgi:hypothetical protein
MSDSIISTLKQIIFKISKIPSHKNVIEINSPEDNQIMLGKFIEGRWTKEEKNKLYEKIIFQDLDISWRKVSIEFN